MSVYRMAGGEVRHLFGWRRDRPDHRDFRTPTLMHDMPLKVDLRHMCPPINDQGQLGSCTANAACEALEYLEGKGNGDGLFSRLFLYYVSRSIEGTPADADTGCQIRDVMKALSSIGVCMEPTWPYNPVAFSAPPSADAYAEAEKHKAVLYYRCPNLYTLQSSLVQSFPVVFGFSVPENMMSEEAARTGMVTYPAANEGFDGGHAVLAVGFDDSIMVGAEKGAVLCQNSWGESWGIAGCFWLPYQFFFHGLATDMWTIRIGEVD